MGKRAFLLSPITYYSSRLLVCERIDDDVDAKACIVLGGKAFVRPIVVPFAAVVFVGVEDSNAPIYFHGFQVIVNKVVAPAVQFVRRGGRPFLEFEESAVKR